MNKIERPARSSTHEVTNQSKPLIGYNVFEQDRVLTEALERENAGWAKDQAVKIGELAGGDAIELGFQANQNPPVLKSYDRFGHRIDQVDFHKPVHVGDVVSFLTATERIGTSSVKVCIRVDAERYATRDVARVTEAHLTMVAIDADGRPTPVGTPPAAGAGRPEP